MRRASPRAISFGREAAGNTSAFALVGRNNRKPPAPRFLHVLEPARTYVVAAAAVGALRDQLGRFRRCAASLPHLCHGTIESVDLGDQILDGWLLDLGLGAESVNCCRAMFGSNWGQGGRTNTTSERGPGNARAALMLALEQNNAVEVRVN